MKIFNHLNLKSRIIISTLGTLSIVLVLVISIIVDHSRNSAIRTANELSLTQAREMGTSVQMYLEKPLNEARALAATFEALKNAGNTNREEYLAIIRESLNKNQDFLAVWVMYESNKLDGQDELYAGDEIYDEEGRFNASIYRENGELLIEKGSVDNYSEAYYANCFATGNESIEEPYFYSYVDDTTRQYFETSIVVPIYSGQERVGVVGVDINLKQLNKLNAGIRVYETGHGFLLSNQGIVVAHPDSTRINKTLHLTDSASYKEALAAVRTGKIHQDNRVSDYLKTEAMYIYTPVKIGQTITPWSVVVVAPLKEVLADASRILYLSVLVGFFGLLVMGVISWWVANNLSRPILKSVQVAREISEGNLMLEINTNRKDEIGILLQALGKMTKQLGTMVGSIKNNSENIAVASQQMSASSEQLSQGATEQASSLEEISSTMEEIAANIESNTENARQTEKIATDSAAGIRTLSEAASRSLDSVRDITDKIKIVNDIAFQTNLLALNAAIEAARAGEYGKGFAVVASEVRKLAERSKVAADQIVNLAETSLKITEEGSGIMKKIIPDIEKTAELVKEIAAASSEQNNGVQQVNLSIQQLNNVTQQNAASSEELSTSSEQLAAQAEELKGMIRYFRIENGRKEKPGKVNRTVTDRHEKKGAPVSSPLPKVHPTGVLLDLPINGNGNGKHREENFDEVKFY